MGISLFLMAVVGFAVGAVMFSVAVGIVLVAYILIRRKSSSAEEAPEQENPDEIKLREWDEHVKGLGGYTQKERLQILKKQLRANRKKR